MHGPRSSREERRRIDYCPARARPADHAIEGIDGAGKTTLAAALHEVLAAALDELADLL